VTILTRLAAWLGITRTPAEHTLTADGFDVCPLPRALDALEAVLAPRQLHEVPGGQRWCLHCGGDWPCPTVDAAETAPRGES
jgi:hypothetical protein